ncbi:hypothetical protein DL767_006468 [Monosporascus sp. MG133]|nr:hypothetical protein DL767_006468 [Monosporascus sp. MG133]
MASTATGHGPPSANDFGTYRYRYDRLELAMMPLNIRHVGEVTVEDTSGITAPSDEFEGPVCVHGSFIVKHSHGINLAGDIWVEQQLSAPTNELEVRDQLCCKGEVTAQVLRLRNGTLYSEGKATVSVSAHLLNGKWESEEITVGPTGQVVYGCLSLEGKGMIEASITYVQSLLHNCKDANYIISGPVVVNGDVEVASGSVLQVESLVVLGDLHVHSGALLAARKVTVSRTTIVDTGGQLTADEMSGGCRLKINLEE